MARCFHSAGRFSAPRIIGKMNTTFSVRTPRLNLMLSKGIVMDCGFCFGIQLNSAVPLYDAVVFEEFFSWVAGLSSKISK